MRETNFTLRTLRWVVFSLVMTFICINGTIAQPYCAMACNNDIQVSLNGNCEAEITFDMMLEDPWNDNICLPNGNQAFQVLVMDPNGNTIPTSPFVTCDQIGAFAALGGVVPVKVKHWSTGNECWGTIIIEDKLKPVLNCPPLAIMCNVAINVPLPSVTDNCDNYPNPQNCGAITLEYTEEWIDYDCVPNNGLSARVIRTYTATDASGNTSSCDQVIDLMRATFADVDMPPHYDNLPGNQPAIDCSSACAALLDSGEDAYNCVGYPSKGGIAIDVAGGYCEINVTKEDTRIDICDGSFKILRDWRLVDWCTGEIWDYTQIIKVIDNETYIVCPVIADLGTNDGPQSCSWSGTLPPAQVYQNAGLDAECSSWNVTTRVYVLVPIPPYGLGTQEDLFATINGNGGQVSGLPLGHIRVNYEVTDDCGNHANCDVEFYVIDDVAPTPVCDEHTVATLAPYPTCDVLIYAWTFDDGSHDNCCAYEDLIFEVSKNANSGYGEYVTYDDCVQNQMVFLRVTDCYENTSQPCMIEVSVDDKDDPIITCPDDKTIECWYPYDNEGDATAVDCSDFDITKTLITTNIDLCGIGFVRYSFTATDVKGNSAQCVQQINIVDSTPLTVSFPPNRTVECTTAGGGGYQGSLDPEDLPGSNNTPNVGGEDCELVAVQYFDQVFPISDSACFKVLREWVVINWCIFDADGPHTAANGYWSDIQEIKVIDTAAPVVDCPADFTVGIFNDDCDATVDIPVPDADDCAPEDYLNYSVYGDFSSFSTPNVGPGTYNAVVRVEDGCNNKTDCPIIITVEDQKNPTAYCKDGLVITLMNTTPPMVPIWASDFDDGSYDNCPGGVSVSFSPTNPVDPGQVFTCDNIGQNPITVYITDAAGNQDFCETFVDVQDNQGVCSGDPGDPLIAGATNTSFGDEPVEDVEVAINGGAMSSTVMTDANGYNLNVPAGGDYTVAPSLDINPLNGVSTFDLVIMRKHILSIQTLATPYQMIAADVNNSGSITTLDMVNLRKLILQINTTFTNNSSWRFVEAAYNFPEATNPWAEAFPEVININNVNSAINNVDFVAIKVGDLNGNASTSQNLLGADDRSNTTMTITADNAKLTRGEQVTVDFTAADFAATGYQFTLDFDQASLELVDVVNGVAGAENFGLTLLSEGAITTSWNGEATDDVLFSLTFAATADVTLSEALSISSRYATAEAYDANGDVQNVELTFNGTTASSEFELYQNTPNPFNGETVIGFNLPTEAAATLSIQDVSGKVIMVIENTFAKGYNQVTIDGANLPSTGVMYYTLKSDDFTATHKMIMIK